LYLQKYIALPYASMKTFTVLLTPAVGVAAAGRMGMAYMTAWTHVQTLNRRFRSPVVAAQRGGKTGGGAVLTEMGRQVIALYHRMEEQSHAAIQGGFREFQTLLKR